MRWQEHRRESAARENVLLQLDRVNTFLRQSHILRNVALWA